LRLVRSYRPLVLAIVCGIALNGAARSADTVSAPAWEALAGHPNKVVLVDFWASWCAPCLRSFPWMNDLQRRYRDRGLVVIAVNVDQDRKLAEAFLRQHPAGFQLEFDSDGERARQFGVRAMPTSVLIDRRGQLRARHNGFRQTQQAEREQQILELLGERT
jgi:cytochrome c biogenesis protein CcmG, thiol:disulfide interchange protein DsbE